MFVGIYKGIESFQGYLGGAKWISSIHGIAFPGSSVWEMPHGGQRTPAGPWKICEAPIRGSPGVQGDKASLPVQRGLAKPGLRASRALHPVSCDQLTLEGFGTELRRI